MKQRSSGARTPKRVAVLLALLAPLGPWAGCGPDTGHTSAGAGPVTAERAREALDVVDPLDRSIAWGALLAGAPPDALPALREAISTAPLDVGDPELVSFAMWWARFDPTAALVWTEEEWRAQSRLVVAAVFRVWAHRDPETAFGRIAEVPEFHRDAALDAVIAGWHESGQPGLLEHVKTLPEDAFRQNVADKLARRVVLVRGTEEATRWAASIEDGQLRALMIRRVASAASEQGDAARIAAWALPHITSGDERPSGFPRRIGTRWILRDPEAALAWLASLPAGADRDDGVMESYRDWSRYAPGAALHWIQNAELERWSEPAFSIFARSQARQDPKAALELVSRFSDPSLRDRTTTVIARAWAAKDPKAASAWLAEAEIPDEVRRRASAPLRGAKAN